MKLSPLGKVITKDSSMGQKEQNVYWLLDVATKESRKLTFENVKAMMNEFEKKAVEMTKHRFVIGKTDESGQLIGVGCIQCDKVAPYRDGSIPAELKNEECPDATKASSGSRKAPD